MNKLRILYAPHDSKPEVKSISNRLLILQVLVGGYIETVRLPELEDHQIVMVVNEEGIIKQLPLNKNLLPFFYVGDVFFVAEDGEEFVSLSDDQLSQIFDFLERLKEIREEFQ